MKLLLILVLGLMAIQNSLVSGEKILIATGTSVKGRETEIIDLENPDFFCTTKQFPTVTWGATGGLIDGITVLSFLSFITTVHGASIL